MQKKNVLIYLYCSTYIFNMLPMQRQTTSHTKNVQRLDKINFKDKKRKVKQPQCLFCERILNEPDTIYKCDACKDTKIKVILTQRFSDKLSV